MTEILSYVAAFAVGAAAASVFMLILWKSIQRLGKYPHATQQMIVGGLLRHGIVYSVFYAIVYTGGWSHLLSALFGFVVIRSLAIVHFGQARAQQAKRELI